MTELLQIIPLNNDILKSPSIVYEFGKTPIDPQILVDNLIRTCNANKGLAIAAPQCNIPYRVFVIAKGIDKAFFNPTIVNYGDEKILLEEGCLSAPFLYIKIKRPSSIRVRFQDVKGETFTEHFTGLTARIVQHEVDHLNGIRYTDVADIFHKTQAFKKQKAYLRKQKHK